MHLNTIALVQAAGSVFMILGGAFSEPDVFLVIGNLLCVIGNGIWIHIVNLYARSDTGLMIFGGLAFCNLIVLLLLLKRYIHNVRTGKSKKSDSDEEEEEEESENDRVATHKELKSRRLAIKGGMAPERAALRQRRKKTTAGMKKRRSKA